MVRGVKDNSSRKNAPQSVASNSSHFLFDNVTKNDSVKWEEDECRSAIKSGFINSVFNISAQKIVCGGMEAAKISSRKNVTAHIPVIPRCGYHSPPKKSVRQLR